MSISELAKTRSLIQEYVAEIHSLKKYRQKKVDAGDFKDAFHYYMHEIRQLRDVVGQLREKELLLMKAELHLLVDKSDAGSSGGGRKLVWSGK